MQKSSMSDWDDLRFFLAVARHGTLSAASRHLHVTQSTVSRRLASLQATMGVRLLQRTGEGYVLTLAGEMIRPQVERAEVEMMSIQRTVAGQDVRLEGVVRVSSTQLLTSHLLAPCFASLHNQHSGILVESLPDTPGEPLASDSAEIAIRLRPFEHHDLVMRTVGHLAFGLYGCISYITRYGEPDLGSGCTGHHLITLGDDREFSAQAVWLTEHAGRARVVLKADSYETQHWVASCGGGLALLPRFRADGDPALHRISTPEAIPSSDIWLGVHQENRRVPRVRTVLDCIAHAIRNRALVLDPPEPAQTDS